jgi:ABC-2 type transport system ATP-binding protein
MTFDLTNNSIEILEVNKSFNSTTVVNSISFTVFPGDIFGFIGPNGAGKTTTIRMIMDIIKPDSGEITVFGRRFNERTKNKVGYLPEERGLYKKLSVFESLCYLATLKGVELGEARRRASELLERTGLIIHRKKRIDELSRGMGQIIQFLITIIHNPNLIILDEPFANLDPVNTELLKEIIYELKEQGTAIVLSTHRMNEVEELCNRIFMINKGRGVLYGDIAEIKSKYRRDSVLLEYEGKLGDLKGVVKSHVGRNTAELFLDGETSSQEILEQLIYKGVKINRYEVTTPPLNEIFLQVVDEVS